MCVYLVLFFLSRERTYFHRRRRRLPTYDRKRGRLRAKKACHQEERERGSLFAGDQTSLFSREKCVIIMAGRYDARLCELRGQWGAMVYIRYRRGAILGRGERRW